MSAEIEELLDESIALLERAQGGLGYLFDRGDGQELDYDDWVSLTREIAHLEFRRRLLRISGSRESIGSRQTEG